MTTSWYNQFRKRTSAFKREMLLEEMREPIDRDSIGRLEYVLHPEIGLPHVIEYHNVWWRIARQHPHALVLRYEDLREDTVGSLRRVAEFLGEAFSEEQLAAAAAFGSIDNMRALEHGGFFRNKSLRLRDASDPETFKVRRARVGGASDRRADKGHREVMRASSPPRTAVAPPEGLFLIFDDGSRAGMRFTQ